MSCFERSIEVQAPLRACFGLWIANDLYPRCPFVEIPALPTGWSSADAWGENKVDGARKLTWALIGNLSVHTKSICWRLEETLQGKLINLSGFMTFDVVDGFRTKVTLTMSWNSVLEDNTFHQFTNAKPGQLLEERLEAFGNLVSASIPYARRLKAVV